MLKRKAIIKCELEIITGLHIGAGDQGVEIGGIDNAVIRAILKNNQPYIPGSSLKGKIRSLLEQARGISCVDDEDNKRHTASECEICKAFGSSAAETGHASRIIFRDAYLTEESEKELRDLPTPYPYTEEKTEVKINRITGTSTEGLRQTERIPAGAKFKFDIIINEFTPKNNSNGNNELELEKIARLLKAGIELLHHDYLGGSGSRGYGQVEIRITEFTIYKVNNTSDIIENGKVFEKDNNNSIGGIFEDLLETENSQSQ